MEKNKKKKDKMSIFFLGFGVYWAYIVLRTIFFYLVK